MEPTWLREALKLTILLVHIAHVYMYIPIQCSSEDSCFNVFSYFTIFEPAAHLGPDPLDSVLKNLTRQSDRCVDPTGHGTRHKCIIMKSPPKHHLVKALCPRKDSKVWRILIKVIDQLYAAGPLQSP
jgi:hypothetical protein